MSWVDSVTQILNSAGSVYADVESAKANRESLEIQMWKAEQDAAIRGSVATTNIKPIGTHKEGELSSTQVMLLSGSALLLVAYLILKR